jgi:SAM-dependent methyltransferase
VLQRCADCETVSTPEYADPEDVYVDGYMFGGAGDFGLDVRGAAFQEFLANVAQRRMSMIERTTGLRGGKHLDVGSGTGEVLDAARERGWTTQGVEPERTAAAMARERGLDVIVATLDESGLPERSFDLVTAFHVLEHIPDSRSFLRTLSRWVRPGGFVAIEVPNFESLQRRRLGADWSGLRPLEHIVHFTPETLERAFRGAGIEPMRTRTPLYIGPPQSLDQALADLSRARVEWLVRPLSRGPANGGEDRYPTAVGWSVLRAVASVHERMGAGGVVVAIGRAPG